MLPTHLPLVGLVGSLFLVACSSSSTPASGAAASNGTGGTSAITDAGKKTPPPPAVEAGPRPVDPFSGSCTTARWASVTDACWSCMCGICAPTLNACNDNCIKILACALEKKTLVNGSEAITCEISMTGKLCLQDPALQAEAKPLVAFDGCLIGATKPAGQFRACEEECGIKYSGDVCARSAM